MVTRICCAHAGGQGKTTVAQCLYVAAKKAGIDVSLVSADFVDETGRSKIGRMYPDLVDELGTGPDVGLAKDTNDLSANVRYWDTLGPVLIKGNTVVDVGANVVDQLINWGKIRRAPALLAARSAPPIDVYLVCKAEQRAVDDMTDLVQRFGLGDAYPVRKIFIVLNEQGGGFDGMALREKIAKLRVQPEIQFISLARCASELWVPMEKSYVSLEKALEMNVDEIQAQLSVDFWSVFSGMDDLSNWFSGVGKEFRRVGAI